MFRWATPTRVSAGFTRAIDAQPGRNGTKLKLDHRDVKHQVRDVSPSGGVATKWRHSKSRYYGAKSAAEVNQFSYASRASAHSFLLRSFNIVKGTFIVQIHARQLNSLIITKSSSHSNNYHSFHFVQKITFIMEKCNNSGTLSIAISLYRRLFARELNSKAR